MGQDITVRFLAKFQQLGPDECWPWLAARLPKGYGVLGRGGRERGNVYAHRFAYEHFVGPIPEGAFVCHRCDNPPCVNPAHLFLGDAAANTADKVSKGRHPRGETAVGAKISAADVDAIRARYANGGTTHAELAREYGLARNTVTQILLRYTWDHDDAP